MYTAILIYSGRGGGAGITSPPKSQSALAESYSDRTYRTMQIESTILLLAILQLLGAGVIAAVAPDDQQSQCTSTEFPTSPGHGLVGAYTNTQKPLMDSYWYNPLAGSNGVWHLIHENVDTTGVSAPIICTIFNPRPEGYGSRCLVI